MNKTFKNTSDKTVPVVHSANIQRLSMITKAGNTLSFFYNTENSLLVVVDKNDNGGNELVRLTLNEKKLLAHV